MDAQYPSQNHIHFAGNTEGMGESLQYQQHQHFQQPRPAQQQQQQQQDDGFSMTLHYQSLPFPDVFAINGGAYNAQDFAHQDASNNLEAQQAFAHVQAFSAQNAFSAQPTLATSPSSFAPNNATFPQITQTAALQNDTLAAAVSLRPQASHPVQLAQLDDRKASMDSAGNGPQSPAANTDAASTGPVSRVVQIPPRPKPGRKPMPPGEASDRRRTQNRMAQRNFRDKRQQKVCELNDELTQLHGKLHSALAEIQMLKQQHAEELRVRAEHSRQREEQLLARSEASERRAILAEQAAASSQAQSSMGMQNPPPDAQGRFPGPKLPAISTQAIEKSQEVAIPTPPEDNWNEIDMTEVWMRSKPPNDQQHDSNWSGYEMDTDPINGSGCGFCTDESNCACKASVASVPKQTSSGPGTCARCQSDPALAAECRSLANKTLQSNNAPAEPSTKTMSCGQFIDKLKAHPRMPSIAELFGPLHAFPARNGFNVDEQEAAKALQDMSAMSPPARH